MPWKIERRDNKYCVVKKNTGETVKCHDSKPKAVKHLRALYVNVKEEDYSERHGK